MVGVCDKLAPNALTNHRAKISSDITQLVFSAEQRAAKVRTGTCALDCSSTSPLPFILWSGFSRSAPCLHCVGGRCLAVDRKLSGPRALETPNPLWGTLSILAQRAQPTPASPSMGASRNNNLTRVYQFAETAAVFGPARHTKNKD